MGSMLASTDYRSEKMIIAIYNLDTKLEETIHDSYGDLLDWLQSEVEE